MTAYVLVERVGVGEGEVRAVVAAVDGALVEQQAAVVDECAVPDLTHLLGGEVVGEPALQGGLGVRAGDVPLVQGVDVPHPGTLAERVVLTGDVAEVEGPHPAAEVVEGAPLSLLDVVEG